MSGIVLDTFTQQHFFEFVKVCFIGSDCYFQCFSGTHLLSVYLSETVAVLTNWFVLVLQQDKIFLAISEQQK